MADVDDEYIHALFYGKNGLGKTTLACQFEKPLALVAIEHTQSGGSRSVKKIEGIIHFSYAKFKEENPNSPLTHSEWVRDLGIAFKVDEHYKTVVVDSGSALDEIILAEVCNWDQTLEMNRWGKVDADQYTERSERMRKVLRNYLDLKKNVIIIANEKDHNSEQNRKSAIIRSVHSESFFSAAMGGGTTKWVQDGCDYVCQLYMDKEIVYTLRTVGKKGQPGYKETRIPQETGKLVRRLRTQFHPNYMARMRSESPEQVPEYIEAVTPTEMYEKFMQIVKGEYEVEK